MRFRSRYLSELSSDKCAGSKREEGKITFNKDKKPEVNNPRIWAYLVYECPKCEEKVLCDLSIITNTNPLKKFLVGKRLAQVAVDINEYLKYKNSECEYLDVQLLFDWDSQEGIKISNLLLKELKAFKTSSIFAEDLGKKYIQAVLDEFIKAVHEIIKTNGTAKIFEAVQDDVLNKIRIDDVANFIIEYNNSRIWQAALPNKSKAIEYAFNSAFSYFRRLK